MKSNDGSGRTEPRIVAVIDIGATSVRMMIAEIRPDGTTHELESLAQAVPLGRDTFMNGEISRATTEDCVHVLAVYREKLREYGIDRPEDIRVVATSAVREADNRLAFEDRIFIATGLSIQPFDEASLHRTTFIGIKPVLDQHPSLNEGQTIVCEVGGGTTEILAIEDGRVTFANTYRLGSLRLIKTLEAFQAVLTRSSTLMESQIEKTANQISAFLGNPRDRRLVVMGGDMRLAAGQIAQDAVSELLVQVSLDQLEQFTSETVACTPDALVKKYQLSVNEAQSLAPALLINLHLAQALGVNELNVARVNLREGLINDLLLGDQWMGGANDQVLESALTLGRRFSFDEKHAMHIDYLANQIFEQTRPMHRLGHQWQLLLRMAARLHEIGLAISERSYHKHSMYVIRNSSFFGLSSRDLERVSLIARYHRRALPQMRHDSYAQLDRNDRVNISKMAAILRVAKSLDASRTQRITEMECQPAGNELRMFVPGITDVSLEQLELKRERVLFENIFGIRPELTLVPLDNEKSGLLRHRT